MVGLGAGQALIARGLLPSRYTAFVQAHGGIMNRYTSRLIPELR